MIESQKNMKKMWLIGGVGFVVLLVLLVIFYFVANLGHSGEAKIRVLYAPYAAKVSVDGMEISNNAENWLALGQHQVLVEMTDFESLTETVEITEETELFGALMPRTAAGDAYLKEHLNEFLAVEGVGGAAALETGLKEKLKYPILLDLPINSLIYSISYQIVEGAVPEDIAGGAISEGTLNDAASSGTSDGALSETSSSATEHLRIAIATDETYLNAAVTRLLELDDGALATYEILVKGVENPFRNPLTVTGFTNTADFLTESFANVKTDYRVSDWTNAGD